MPKSLEIYKCEVCGNIVEMLHGGSGALVCCGEEMKLYEENTVDAAREKHVPACERSDGNLKVQIGSVPHPMVDEHYIEWIEVIDGDKVTRISLQPGQDPNAEFCCAGKDLLVREYCSIHGLWKAEA